MSQPSFDFAPAAAEDAATGDAPELDVTYSVGDVVDAVNGALRRSFGNGFWVRGEIQGWSERGAHAYFRLVEDGPRGKAVLNVQLFAPSRARLRPILERHRLRLGDGVKVRIFGNLDFYGPSGQLGLKMAGVDPRFTLGEMAMQRDDVIRKLVAAGLYDANRARSLTAVPLRVGVITSTSSAAFADFVHEIDRSGFAFQLRVVDVRVQGADAVSMISRAIRKLGARDDVDVVVLVRGGGAKTDLAVFDHETIAQAIAHCPIPVFTGLGHEIDRSIADDVAHSALKTPTACAAALAELVAGFIAGADTTWASIGRRAVQLLDRADHELVVVAGTAGHRARAAVDRSHDRLRRHATRVRSGSERVIARADARLGLAQDALVRAPRRLDAETRHLDGLEAQVRFVDPVRTMARGWSITRGPDGRAVTDASRLAVGSELTTTFAAGRARSTVDAVEPDANGLTSSNPFPVTPMQEPR